MIVKLMRFLNWKLVNQRRSDYMISYQDDPGFSRLLDLLEEGPVVVRVGEQLPHGDLQSVEGPVVEMSELRQCVQS